MIPAFRVNGIYEIRVFYWDTSPCPQDSLINTLRRANGSLSGGGVCALASRTNEGSPEMHKFLRVCVALMASGLCFVTVAITDASAKPGRPKPAPGCGGTAIPKAGGGYWTCTFDDEFTGNALDTSKWAIQTTGASGFTSGTECFVNSPNNVAVSNGVLSLTARAEAAPFTCADPGGAFVTRYTSGEVLTYGKFSQAYGRFEVSAKFPSTTVKGLQEALWLWPDDPRRYGSWPWSGEIDIAEVYSQYADRAIPTVHYVPLTTDPNTTNYQCLIKDIGQFHRYVVEWTTQAITISYDGQVCISDNWVPMPPLLKPQPFDQPFMVALTQALGVGGNAFDPATTPLPATTQIDYVRVWR
jgi:beta-glucanase (GH16 family)